MKDRKNWPNKWIFILAAVGSAAGLGNLWRFPFLAYEHGGGAFLLALIIGYLLIGIPLLTLETGLGQKTQKAAADAYGSIKKGFRYLGWSALSICFLVVTYYMAVLSWGFNYLKESFSLGWGSDTSAFFFDKVLNISKDFSTIGGIENPLLIGFIFGWIAVYFAAWKGVESISKVVVWTATIPFLILFALILRSVTLPGASIGLSAFFIPEWQAMADLQLWLAALSQVFFSLSLAFGIMIAYGSYQPKNSGVVKNVLRITFGNFLVSLMSGIVVFGTLGYMSLEQGSAFKEVVAGGPSLAFVAFPKAINLLPSFSVPVAVLFFVTLLTLAIDSAFSLLEAFSSAIKDRLPTVSTEKIVLALSSIGALVGLLFITEGGIRFLDTLDHFVVNYGLVIIALIESLLVGWTKKGEELKEFIKSKSEVWLGRWWGISIKYLTPLFLITLLVTNAYKEFQAPYEGYPVWGLLTFGVLPLILVPLVSLKLDSLGNS
ncbi:MAG: sodium-dependent transporter [Candidatus Magasanikbacteria bacterium]